MRFMFRAPRQALAVLALLCVTLAGYANSFPGSFLWDDASMIVGNPLVSAPDLREIFTTDYCGRAANCGTYRPLTVLSYALNRRLIGPGPASFHAVNVALHAAVTLLLYLLLEALGFGLGLSWLAAAIFGVHPIHTEVVNIATFRSESLGALCVLLALWAAVRRGRGHLAIAVVAFACALLSKESGLVFLLLLPLLDAFRSANVRVTLRERRSLYVAVLAVTAGWFMVRHLVALAATVPPDLIYPVDNPLVGLSWLPSILTALKAQLKYLGLLLFPIRLQAVYTGSSVGVVTSLFSAWGLICGAFAGLVLVAAVRGWRSRSAFGFGLLFYAASFALTANFVFTMPVLLGERLAYLPSAGFCLALASLLWGSASGSMAESVVKESCPRLGECKIPLFPPLSKGEIRRLLSWGPRFWPCAAARVLCCGYLLLLGGLLLLRNKDFAGELPLAQAATRRDPGNTRAWYFLGGAYERQGDIPGAEQALRQGIAADPGFPENYGALAWLLARNSRYAEARDLALQALRLVPGGYPPALLTLARSNLGLGNPAEARVWLEKAAPVFLWKETFWDLRARILEAQGDLPGALVSSRRAFALNEGTEAGLDLSGLLLRSGLKEEAQPILRRLESRLREQLRNSESPWLLNLYGFCLVLQENYTLAVPAFRRAMELDPGAPLYRSNYERALKDAARAEKILSP